jgi:hypothetical protein
MIMTGGMHNRIDLVNIPFTDRGSRLLLFRQEHQFSLRLAERWQKWEQEVGHYRNRPPMITHFTLLTDAGLPVTDIRVESEAHAVWLHTALGVFTWVFVDPETILLRLPAGTYRLEFRVRADRGETDRRGGALRGKRNVAYTTNAHLIENALEAPEGGLFQARLRIAAGEGHILLLNVTPRIAYNRSLPDAEAVLQTAEANWRAWISAVPPVLDIYREQYEYAWWILRAGLVNTRYYFTREALLPSKIHYVGVWHWDQVFHAIAYRYIDTRLAEDQLRIMLDHQRADGLIPDAIHDEGLVDHLTTPVNADVTKPPLMAWGALKIFEATGHRDFLEEIYEPLMRWNDWWLHFSSDPGGLAHYMHPFSSGLDDNPLWDRGMPVVAPDLNTYLVLQSDSLARIAGIIGDPDGERRFTELAAALTERMLTQLWDAQRGDFRALLHGVPLETETPFGLLPLLTGRLPRPIIERLIDRLTDPQLFWTPYPLATVARRDPDFNPMQMWRGPVWVNINYLFVEALERAGYTTLAGELRRRTLEMVMGHRDIYEYYHPLTGERPPKAAPMFGWSAALFIDLAIQETRAQTGSAAAPAST